MPKVTFVNEHRVVEAERGTSVRDVARDAGIALDAHRFRGGWSCNGRGLCRACLCWIEESAPGAAGERTWIERVRGLRGWRRLACRARVMGDVRVFTLPAAASRVRVPREIAPAPSPATDASAPRKPIDEASTAEHVKGHPSRVGRGVVVVAPAPSGAPEAAASSTEGDAAPPAPAKPAAKGRVASKTASRSAPLAASNEVAASNEAAAAPSEPATAPPNEANEAAAAPRKPAVAPPNEAAAAPRKPAVAERPNEAAAAPREPAVAPPPNEAAAPATGAAPSAPADEPK